MDTLLTVAGIILAIVWAASSAWGYEIARESALERHTGLDAYDWLQIALGPFTVLPILWDGDRKER
ncbi:hypothetical protein [Caulobacter sp.]|uniref:hypothetical protein n=1 Tax=Caulobacter sp. TaxID=78 RepID=UPI003BAEC426